jgi:NAD(P)-dependent dehydrogenase (short-subunit alcohol dehydrogenase family)
MRDFSGKSVLITGGAKGIGAVMARSFAAAGARVTIGDIEEDKGLQTAAAIGADFRRLDVSSEESWLATATHLQNGPGLDVLVNNAAIFRPNMPLIELPFSVWRQHFAVNLDGTFLGCKLGMRLMQRRGGAIVNVASSLALMSIEGNAAYSTTKAAILMLTRYAAREGGPMNVRVNAILPGAVITDQSRASIPSGLTEVEFFSLVAQRNPIARIGLPEDMAAAVMFLCSDKASFISGAMLNIDGAERA